MSSARSAGITGHQILKIAFPKCRIDLINQREWKYAWLKSLLLWNNWSLALTSGAFPWCLSSQYPSSTGHLQDMQHGWAGWSWMVFSNLGDSMILWLATLWLAKVTALPDKVFQPFFFFFCLFVCFFLTNFRDRQSSHKEGEIQLYGLFSCSLLSVGLAH